MKKKIKTGKRTNLGVAIVKNLNILDANAQNHNGNPVAQIANKKDTVRKIVEIPELYKP